MDIDDNILEYRYIVPALSGRDLKNSNLEMNRLYKLILTMKAKYYGVGAATFPDS